MCWNKSLQGSGCCSRKLQQTNRTRNAPMNVRAFIKVDKAAFYRFIATEPEGRYEYEWGRIVQQQQGGTFRHSRIAAEFVASIRIRVDRQKWAYLMRPLQQRVC